MSKLIKTDTEYARWIQDLKNRYRRAQIKASAKVNEELIRYYWSLGRDIVTRDAENRYGSGFYKNLSQDLKNSLPDSGGFSPVNLFYMRRFYDFDSTSITNLPQPVEDLQFTNSQPITSTFIFAVPWGHHRIIIDKYYKNGDLDAALFYLKKTIEDGWSRNVLKTFIDSELHIRQGKAQSSFSRLLPTPR